MLDPTPFSASYYSLRRQPVVPRGKRIQEEVICRSVQRGGRKYPQSLQLPTRPDREGRGRFQSAKRSREGQWELGMDFRLRESAWGGHIESYRAELDEQQHIDLLQTMHVAKPYMRQILEHSANVRQKIVVCCSIQFIKYFEPMDERREIFYFCSRAERALSNYFIEEALDRCFHKILQSVETFVRNGSGWSISHIRYIDLRRGIY